MDPLFKNRSILLVDDEQDLIDLYRERLESWGFITYGATRANDAIAILSEHGADIVLSDIRMPNGSGFELLARLRALGGKASPVFFFVSTHCEIPEEKLKEMGASGLLEKPLDWKELAQRLVHALQHADQQGHSRPRPLRFRTFAHLAVDLTDSGAALELTTEINIGRGGFFVPHQGDPVPEPDTHLRFKIEIPGSNLEPLEGEAEVRWIRSQAEVEGAPTGYGCRFVKINKGNLEQTLALIEKTYKF
jgi:DNA-binding response OmpR family regulator